MNRLIKSQARRYGWHLNFIASHTYVRRTEFQWVRRRRVSDSHNYRTGGASHDLVCQMVAEGLVEIDGRILRVTVRGRHVVRVVRDRETAKVRARYLAKLKGAN